MGVGVEENGVGRAGKTGKPRAVLQTLDAYQTLQGLIVFSCIMPRRAWVSFKPTHDVGILLRGKRAESVSLCAIETAI